MVSEKISKTKKKGEKNFPEQRNQIVEHNNSGQRDEIIKTSNGTEKRQHS